MSEIKITPATSADIPALVQLVNSAYRGESSKQGWTTEADLLDGIRTDAPSLQQLLNNPGATLLLYISDEVLQGCVYLQKQADKLYLGMLTVAPNLQGGGIGKMLLQAAEAFAIEQGCGIIKITVISVRQELIDWYERHGYKNTGEKQPFPTDPRFGIPKQPLEFIVMEKIL